MRDRVVVLIGATGGIGAALARQLAPLGAQLVLVARQGDRLAVLADEVAALSQRSAPVLVVPTDITDPVQVALLMEQVVSQFGKLDVLVNVAGAGIMKQYHQIEPADLDYLLDVNLKGNFYTCQAAATVMKGNKGGHICNVIGILGKHSMMNAAAYCASKFGAVGFSKCMAEELKRFGVKMTLFFFGGIDTSFWDNVSLKVDRSKMLRPETAAAAILFALTAEPQAVPMEINIQPDSHLFF